jgi:hypothetical protein
MENYLYFSDADGADATGDAGLYAASRFIGVSPVSTTTTAIFFEGAMGTADANEVITLTHANTTSTGDDISLVGHQSRIIANAVAKALLPSNKQSAGMVVMVDLTSGTKIEGLAGVTGVAITIDS